MAVTREIAQREKSDGLTAELAALREKVAQMEGALRKLQEKAAEPHDRLEALEAKTSSDLVNDLRQHFIPRDEAPAKFDPTRTAKLVALVDASPLHQWARGRVEAQHMRALLLQIIASL